MVQGAINRHLLVAIALSFFRGEAARSNYMHGFLRDRTMADWKEIAGNWVAIPPRPVGAIHFLGGAFIAAAPNLAYRSLLEFFCDRGYLVVATPFNIALDHIAIAEEVLLRFDRGLRTLYRHNLLEQSLPIYGLGHSMGCKLHLLIGSLFEVQRAGNALIAFNNFPAQRSIPLVKELSALMAMEVEFSPSPKATNEMISERYKIRRNLLIQFTRDDIDQTQLMGQILQQRFGEMVSMQTLNGNHLTPLGQRLSLQPKGGFSALDAVSQWVEQSVYQDLTHLKRMLLLWLDPFSFGHHWDDG